MERELERMIECFRKIDMTLVVAYVVILICYVHHMPRKEKDSNDTTERKVKTSFTSSLKSRGVVCMYHLNNND